MHPNVIAMVITAVAIGIAIVVVTMAAVVGMAVKRISCMGVVIINSSISPPFLRGRARVETHVFKVHRRSRSRARVSETLCMTLYIIFQHLRGGGAREKEEEKEDKEEREGER